MAFQFTAGALADAARRAVEPAALFAIRRAVADEQRRVLGNVDLADIRVVEVDGWQDGNLSRLKPNSRVTLEWTFLGSAVKIALDYLSQRGPSRSGEWRRSIVVLADGMPLATGAKLPASTREAVVAVTADYARRLEFGTARDGSPFAVQVQQHFVERTVLALRSRYGNLAQFSFDYVDLAGKSRQPSGGRRRRLTDRQREAAAGVRYPAIILRDSGA